MQKYFNLRTMIVLALLAAIGAVLKAYMPGDYFLGDIKIVDVSLIALPVLLAGIYYGPLAGGIVGFIAESVGFFLMPVGTFNPVFSVLMAIAGVIAGLFFLKSDKAGFFRIAGLVTLSQVLCSFILGTLTIHLFYGVPLLALLPGRAIGLLIKIPVLTGLLIILAGRLMPIIKNQKKSSNPA